MRDDDDYDDDDDYGDLGRSNGDPSERGVAFQAANPGMPWLRAGQPPWHMWGNSQVIDLPVDDISTPARTFTPSQLVKISYKRPETWHWLFAARLISGPSAPTFKTFVTIDFELIVGIGRSSVVITRQFAVSGGPGDTGSRPFETLRFAWGPTGTFPLNAFLYTTQVLAPNRVYDTDAATNQTGNAVPPAESASVIDQIVAQDIQVQAKCNARAEPLSPAIGQTVRVEVSAMFAPKVHMRPDWYLQAPDEAVFAGGETGGS